jgi:hypothetical protein
VGEAIPKYGSNPARSTPERKCTIGRRDFRPTLRGRIKINHSDLFIDTHSSFDATISPHLLPNTLRTSEYRLFPEKADHSLFVTLTEP